MTAPTMHAAAALEYGARHDGDQVRWLLSTVKPELWLLAIDYWSSRLVASGVRPRTIELRRYQLGHFAEAHLNRSPWSLTTAELTLWLAGQDWSPETRKSYRAALRSFYGWAVQAGHTKRNPAADLPAVRVTCPPPRPAPDSALSEALARASDRDRLILLLAAYAGLRVGEIAALAWADVSFETSSMLVHGKGGKLRTIPMHPLVRGELATEYRRRAAGGFGSGYRYGQRHCECVFPGQEGGPITANRVSRIASGLLPGRWTAHTLRHRFATRALRGTGNLLAVSALLGHAGPDVTKRYTELGGEALAAAVNTV